MTYRGPVAAALALLAAVACGAGQDPTMDVPGTTGTTAPSTSATSAPPAARPDQWIGIDRTGRLVVVESATGAVDRVLGEFDHPTGCPEGDEPVAGCQWVVEVTRSPDGGTVFYETCCEPAPGNVYRVPVGGGTPELVVHGGFPAVDPSGTRVAVVELQWVAVQPLDGRDPVRFGVEGGEVAELVHGMTWSPDGEVVAFSVYDGAHDALRLHLLRVDEATTFADARPVPQPPASSWTLPSYRQDGLLVVAEQQLSLDDGPSSPARGLVVDPRTGAVQDEFEYGGPVQSQHFDASGTHLVFTLVDGSVHWRGPDGATAVLAESGYLAATW